MKKNRKHSKRMSVSAARSMHFGAVIVILFVMVIVNLLASSRCDQMMKTIGEKENLLARLEKDRERECGRWEQLNTPDHLDRILPRLGMSMKYPRAEQIIHMDAHGFPIPGQLSVARAKRRLAEKTKVASNAETRPATRKRR